MAHVGPTEAVPSPAIILGCRKTEIMYSIYHMWERGKNISHAGKKASTVLMENYLGMTRMRTAQQMIAFTSSAVSDSALTK